MNLKNVAKALQDKRQVVREVVYDTSIERDAIIHGSRAFNLQSPNQLRKKTKDYDILVDKPNKVAKVIAERLRQRGEGNVDITKGSHKGTYRIKLNNESIVDVTQRKGKVKSKRVFGLRVKDLSTIKKSTQRLVKKPGTEYRREKDIDTLERIKQVERIESMF